MSVIINSSKQPITSSPTRVRCINLDWLEVHCYEPITSKRDPAYYRSKGFIVEERDYGTRVYRQMFTLMGSDGKPLLEIRRDPASQGLNGIHQCNECHIRLCNRTCYLDNAAGLLETFLNAHGYQDVRISRVDVCMDFVKFDRNDDPQAFVRRYFRHIYAKINQGNITGHGKDTWSGQEWNSLSWGAPSSDIGTKMYNKTMELYDAKLDQFKKPYIRNAWLHAHMIDDVHRCTMNGELVNVWRVEFSVRSSVKRWFKIEIDGKARNFQSIRNTLDCWNGRDRLLVMFASIAQHYFHFKYYVDGQRKDRCKDKVLFIFDGIQHTYKIGHDNDVGGDGKDIIKPLDKLIAKIRLYQQSKSETEIRLACETLIKAMESDSLRCDLTNPWSRDEIEALQRVMAIKCKRPDLHTTIIMKEVKEFLRINDRTMRF